MNGSTEAYAPGLGQFLLGNDLNIDLDRQTLLDMIEKAKPIKYFPAELREILSEELGQYFAGVITEDMLIDNLESRVGLYVAERK